MKLRLQEKCVLAAELPFVQRGKMSEPKVLFDVPRIFLSYQWSYDRRMRRPRELEERKGEGPAHRRDPGMPEQPPLRERCARKDAETKSLRRFEGGERLVRYPLILEEERFAHRYVERELDESETVVLAADSPGHLDNVVEIYVFGLVF